MFLPVCLLGAATTDWTEERLRAISLFVVVLLLASLAVRVLWNRAAADWPRLPRIGYGRSLAVVALWGLLCLVVLTMIATTREVMMPGSWPKVGLLYSTPPDLAAGESLPADGRPTVMRVGRMLLLGWFDFLGDRLSRVRTSPTAILAGLGLTAVFVVLVDRFARWCVHGWRLRWSLAIVASVALLFVVAYCTIGLARQLGWLLLGSLIGIGKAD